MSRLDSLAVRVFVILLLGFAAAAGLAFAISGYEQRARSRAEHEYRLTERAADAANVLSRLPAGAWPDRLGVGPEALRVMPGAAWSGPLDADLTSRVQPHLGGGARVRISLPRPTPCAGPDAPPPPAAPPAAAPPAPPPPPPPGACRMVSLSLTGGREVVLAAPGGPEAPAPRLAFGAEAFAAIFIVGAALAWWVARLATAPVDRLARAALTLGDSLDRPPLAVEGPREVRQAAAAFNTMQDRLRDMVEERTQLLAAITHDLQTPLTRQRLRIERVSDPDLREDLLADQEAMRVLIREGLDLARADHDGEGDADLDVDSLLDSLADDARAAGGEAEVTARCGRAMRTHPEALRRCLANLVDNAIQYAGHAELAAEPLADGLLIRISDRGGDAPAGDLDRLLRPFVRGETSRSRETGGAGLGLTIADKLARRAGGVLSLHRRTGGGFEARVRFPGR